MVDPASEAFQCSDNGEKQFTLPFAKGKKLKCMSPSDTEYFLKACKRGENVALTECVYSREDEFICTDVMGRSYPSYVYEMENYFCLTDQHKRRVVERCKTQ